MKKHTKLSALLCIVLSLCMLLQLMPFSVFAQGENTSPTAPTGLLLDLLEKNLGLDNLTNPSMSWIVNDADNNEVQSAYQILVSSSKERADAGIGDVWDSGKVTSAKSTDVRYGGSALAPDSIYYWQVRTWDKDHAPSPYSAPSFFATKVGAFSASPIWIGDPVQAASWTNYTVNADFTLGNAPSSDLTFILRSTGNTQLEFTITQESGSAILTPIVVKAGVPTSRAPIDLASKGITLTAGISNAISIQADNSIAKVSINGTQVALISDLDVTSGVIGFSSALGGGTIDNLSVVDEDAAVLYETGFNTDSIKFTNATVTNSKLVVAPGKTCLYNGEKDALNAAWSDYTFEADVKITAAALGICFRAKDSNNFSMWQVRSTSAGSPANAIVPHTRTNGNYVAGTSIGLSAKGVTVLQGTYFALKVVVNGTNLKFYINNVLVDEVNNLPFSYGVIGFRTGNTETGSIKNMKVTSNASGKVLYNSTADLAANVNRFSAGSVSGGEQLVPTAAVALLNPSGSSAVTLNKNAGFIRKEFEITKPVAKAIAHVTGTKPEASTKTRQYSFKFSVNGQYAGLGVQNGYNPNAGTFYNNFDITDQLAQGNNCVSAIVYALSSKAFLAQIKIFYQDGTTEIISTDSSWKTLDGTAAFGEGVSSIGNGVYTAMAEHINANIYPFGFDLAGYNDSKWGNAAAGAAMSNFRPSSTEVVGEYEMPVTKVVDKGNGNYYLELDKEIIGGLQITFPDGVQDAKITLRYGEQATNNVVKYTMNTGNKYEEFWTLKAGPQTIKNWGMKNFRYIEILGSPVAITADMVKGIALRTEFDDEESYFESSSSLLEEVYELCKYTIKATNQDVFVDSQSRERLAYEGDLMVNALSSFAVSRNYALNRHSAEYLLYNQTWPTEYKQINIMGLWEDYMYTGNFDALERNYSKLKEKVYESSLKTFTVGGKSYRMIFINGGSNNLVDWPTNERDGYKFDEADYNTCVQAFVYGACLQLVDIATLMGNTADAEKYAGIAADLKKGVNELLYNPTLGRYSDGLDAPTSDGQNPVVINHYAQHASVFPILFGMAPDQAVSDKVTATIAAEGIKGSVYESQFVLDTLYKNNQGQAALGMMTSTGLKSWYHAIYNLRATISVEAWDPSLKSNMTLSHPWGASPGNNIVRGMFGVVPLEPGFNKLQIKPQIGNLEYANVKTPTIKGSVFVDVNDGGAGNVLGMTVTTPVNTLSTVYVPATKVNHNIVVVDGVAVEGNRVGDYYVFENVGSGVHTFNIPTAAKLSVSVENDQFNYIGTEKQLALTARDRSDEIISLDGTSIAYSSSNTAAATIDADGLISFVGTGNTSITATVTMKDVEIMGITIPHLEIAQSIDLSVKTPLLKEVALTADQTTLGVDDRATVKLQGLLESLKEYQFDLSQVKLISSDESVATVDANGVVTTHKAGSVTISAFTQDGMQILANDFDTSNIATGDMMFEDNFDTRANFTNGTISDGNLVMAKSQNALCTTGSNWNNYTVETRFKVDTNAASLWFRAADSGRNYLWQVNIAGDIPILKTHVFRTTSDFTQFAGNADISNAYIPNDYNVLKVMIVGNTFYTYLNDILIDIQKDDTYSSGTVGFRNGSSESQRYDWVKVYKSELKYDLDLTVLDHPIDAYVNEPFTFTVTAPSDITRLKMTNETDMSISMTSQTKLDNGDGTATWTVTTAVGTAGQNRTFSILGKTDDTEYTSLDTVIRVNVYKRDPRIISAAPSVTSATVNQEFTVRVVTTNAVKKLKITNESGSSIGLISSAKVDEGADRVWTLTIKIGSSGLNRSLNVFCAGDDGLYLDDSVGFNIDILKALS